MKKIVKGRGAQNNPPNPYHQTFLNDEKDIPTLHENNDTFKTSYTIVYPKTILNKNDSPDIPFDYSLNPYQGCEHGCVYCYARNTHPYWGYSAGLDFEQKILVKLNAPELLQKTLEKPSWEVSPVMLSGNTDCYQPAERKFEITRKILSIFLQKRHPVCIITKSDLILRDLDLLKALAKDNLTRVVISLNSLDSKTARKMEPRASNPSKRLKTVRILSEHGIPVHVLLAPIVPQINSHEIPGLVKAAAEAGAVSASPIMIRLNGDLENIFSDWLEKQFPDKCTKVLNHIKALHGGKVNESRFGHRMRGSGNFRDAVIDSFRIAYKKYYNEEVKSPPLNLNLFSRYQYPQLKLF